MLWGERLVGGVVHGGEGFAIDPEDLIENETNISIGSGRGVVRLLPGFVLNAHDVCL